MTDDPAVAFVPRTLTPDEIAEQQVGARRIAPGIWLDRHGDVHWSIPELLAHVGIEDTPAHRESLVALLQLQAFAMGAALVIRQDPIP